jgi:hypothetical protein
MGPIIAQPVVNSREGNVFTHGIGLPGESAVALFDLTEGNRGKAVTRLGS